MTSKLKCPVCPMCGSELVRCKTFPYFYYCNCAEYEDCECELDDCAASVPVWEVLRRTKKQLDRAKWWLKEIVENHRHTPITTAEMALKELDNEQ